MTHSILVVDDEADVLLLIRMQLQMCNYEVIEAGSAEQALDLLAGRRPDAMLLDIGLPGMSGWQLLELLGERGVVPAMPVLVVTAHAEPGGHTEAFRLGCRGFMTKPFSPKALRKAVDSLFEVSLT